MKKGFDSCLSRLSQGLACPKGHLVALVLLYLLLFEEYYRFVYRNYFNIMDFHCDFAPITILVGVGFFLSLLGVMFFLKPDNGRLYTLGILVAILFCLPQIVMFQIGTTTIWGPVFSLLLLFLITTPWLRFPAIRPPKLPSRLQQWLLPAVVLLFMIPMFATFGIPSDLSVFALNGHNYEVRQATLSQGNLLTNYLQGPLCNVLLPLLIVYGLSRPRQRWYLVLLGIVLMLYLFLVNPAKTILFSIAVVLVCFLFKDCFAKAGLFIYGILALCAAAVILNLLTGNLMVESVIVRRLFFIPVLVSDAYFSFFDHAQVYLSHSFLGAFFQYPYPAEPSHLIGQMMYGRDTINCNTGIIADGFMNFGLLGSLLFVVLGACVVRLIDAADYDSRFIGLTVLLIINFLNSALFTSLLTHGGIVLILAMLFLVPRKEEQPC